MKVMFSVCLRRTRFINSGYSVKYVFAKNYLVCSFVLWDTLGQPVGMGFFNLLVCGGMAAEYS